MEQMTFFFTDVGYQIANFMLLGGKVLILIAITIFLMWALIAERVVFYYLRLPKKAMRARELWASRADHHSWQAHQIRHAMIGALRQQARAYISTVKTFVALCPLLGLLGTVTGMIGVFDVMASAGMGNARLMADGVAKATVPTMAGMVGALSGVFAIYWLEYQAKHRVSNIEEHLDIEHDSDARQHSGATT